ncbi:hypothetical protein MRB53_013498 [Persea americana]|uniref:Uncharacterized protein n=1 Tax=Persea americana TaxID=3435 RepID=A0ACC2K8L6_PERAE|nr:hypothetical protein MRB53_013498 [Persea americana]
MGQKKDRREYFKSYYKNLIDENKEELRKKKREAYKRKKLVNILHAKVSSSTKITFGGSTSTHNPIEDATQKKECRKTQFQKSYATLSEEKKEILQPKRRDAYKNKKTCNMKGTLETPTFDIISEQRERVRSTSKE